MSKVEAVTLEARRAEVAKGLVARKSYRVLAAELGVGNSTVAADVKALRKEWVKERGGAADMFEDALHDLAVLQAESMAVLDASVGPDRLAAIDRALRVADQRNRLAGLYPRPGIGEDADMPTGPIVVRIEVLPTGNRKLVTDQDDHLDDGLDDEDIHEQP